MSVEMNKSPTSIMTSTGLKEVKQQPHDCKDIPQKINGIYNTDNIANVLDGSVTIRLNIRIQKKLRTLMCHLLFVLQYPAEFLQKKYNISNRLNDSGCDSDSGDSMLSVRQRDPHILRVKRKRATISQTSIIQPDGDKNVLSRNGKVGEKNGIIYEAALSSIKEKLIAGRPSHKAPFALTASQNTGHSTQHQTLPGKLPVRNEKRSSDRRQQNRGPPEGKERRKTDRRRRQR